MRSLATNQHIRCDFRDDILYQHDLFADLHPIILEGWGHDPTSDHPSPITEIHMALRLGDLLVQYKVLTEDQCDQIAEAQLSNPKPFGLLAEEIFGVDPCIIEHAWAVQFGQISPTVDPTMITIDDRTRSLVTARQAWQFGFIPIERHNEGVVCVTSVECLARALRFVGWRVEHACSFVICEHTLLEAALNLHYPIEGVDSMMMNRFLSRPPAA